jgi:hypothetical protein
VAQAILEHGTVRLDPYIGRGVLAGPGVGEGTDPHLIERNGHAYSYFPVGSSLLALPAVALARLGGGDMVVPAHNYGLQRLLAAATVAILFLSCFALARLHVGPAAALAIASAGVLGGPAMSMLGTAYWSQGPATLAIALCLLLMARWEAGRAPTARPVLLGGLLFACFLFRAGTVAFVLPVLVYLFFADRRQFVAASIVSAALLLLFVAWSRREFGSWFPLYYSAERFQVQRASPWLALTGLLFSPSRGLFVFSPFLLLLIPGLVAFGRRVASRKLLWLVLGWLALHLAIVVRAASWWGGAGYGARLMVELTPGFVLLTSMVWTASAPRLSRSARSAAIALFAVLAAAAGVINTVQGLYNPYTALWNSVVEPAARPPASAPGDLFNWRYAQFLASQRQLCAIRDDQRRLFLPYEATLDAYEWGAAITPIADQAIDFRQAVLLGAEVGPAAAAFAPAAIPSGQPAAWLPALFAPANTALYFGWSPASFSATARWTECPEARIVLRLGPEPTSGRPFTLWLRAGAGADQEVPVRLNGQEIGRLRITAGPETPEELSLTFDGGLLRPGALNELLLAAPLADFHGRPGRSPSGMALAALALHPSDQPLAPPAGLDPPADPYP